MGMPDTIWAWEVGRFGRWSREVDDPDIQPGFSRYVRAPEGSVVLTAEEANECLWALNPCAEPCNTPDECGCSVGLKIRRLTSEPGADP